MNIIFALSALFTSAFIAFSNTPAPQQDSKENKEKETVASILITKLEDAFKNRRPLSKQDRIQVRIQVSALMEKARSAEQFNQSQLKILALTNLLTEFDTEFKKSFSMESVWRRHKTIARPSLATLGEAEAFELARRTLTTSEFDRAARKYETNLKANEGENKFSFAYEEICSHYSSIRNMTKADTCWKEVIEAAAPGSLAQQRFSMAALRQLLLGQEATKAQVLLDKSKPYLLHSDFSWPFELARVQTALFLADYDEATRIANDMITRPGGPTLKVVGEVIKIQVSANSDRCSEIGPLIVSVQSNPSYKDVARPVSSRLGQAALKCKDYGAAVGFLRESLKDESWENYLNLQKSFALISAKWLAGQKPDFNDKKLFDDYRRIMKSLKVKDQMTETLLQFGQLLLEANNLKSLKTQKLQALANEIMKVAPKSDLIYAAADEILKAHQGEPVPNSVSASEVQK